MWHERWVRIMVTGSAGHLGEGLARSLPAAGYDVVGLDVRASAFTAHVGSITDREVVGAAMQGVDAVIHTATLHKPHVATHSKQDFVDTNISGTLALLEAAVDAGVGTFVFTSTTSAFGAMLSPPPGAPAIWIDEAVPSVPKNIYGTTKTAAEDLCQLFHRRSGLNCVILRTSRFFPEVDDNAATRDAYADENAKANEFSFRRLDVEDAVSAHIAAVETASQIGFGKYIVSATSPFGRDDLQLLRDAPDRALERHFPDFRAVYDRRGFRMFDSIDRVYVNASARTDLGWRPTFDFARILAQLSANEPIGSQLARDIGGKGYHPESFADGPYPVE